MAAASGSSGCSSAPALNIAGSFFPSWLLCLVVGAVAAGAARALFGAIGFNDKLLYPPLTYLGILICAALATWLALFGA